jgi:hypothetical protein
MLEPPYYPSVRSKSQRAKKPKKKLKKRDQLGTDPVKEVIEETYEKFEEPSPPQSDPQTAL